MSEELVLTEKRGHIQILTLNRPSDMNAFNTALASALGDALGLEGHIGLERDLGRADPPVLPPDRHTSHRVVFVRRDGLFRELDIARPPCLTP